MTLIEVRTPNLKSSSVGKLQAKYCVDGTRILRYFIDFWHNDLKLHKELSAPEIYPLQGKVDALIATWDQKLEAHQKRSAIATGKETRSEEHTSELQSLMRISYAVFCLKTKTKTINRTHYRHLRNSR